MAVERDEVSGQNTTGHEWDGIKELDTPIPKPAIWAYGLTSLFAVLYWILFPAWPYVTDFTRGLLDYSSRATVMASVEEAAAARSAADQALAAGDLTALAADPAIRAAHEDEASILYLDNCAACHGRDLKGQIGFPNLTDGHWLWSGDVEEIATTLRYGINSGHEEERAAEMLAFGAQQMLERGDVEAVVDHVLSLSGQDHDTGMGERGAVVFEENCSSCHGEGGEGGLEIGAPSLIDDQWIYGGNHEDIFETIWSGQRGVMPAWEGRLSETDIRKLALYVHWNADGGGE